MGLSGIGIWQLLIVLMILIMLFGSKRLGSLGADLGSAIRGFRKNVNEDNHVESEERVGKASDICQGRKQGERA